LLHLTINKFILLIFFFLDEKETKSQDNLPTLNLAHAARQAVQFAARSELPKAAALLPTHGAGKIILN